MTEIAPRLEEDRRLVGGPASRQRLARLLGLDRGPEAWELTHVESADERVELTLTREGMTPVVLVLRETSDARTAWLTTGELALTHVGNQLPAGLARHLAHQASRLGRVTLAALLAALRSDPESAERLLPAAEPTRLESGDASSRGVGGECGTCGGACGVSFHETFKDRMRHDAFNRKWRAEYRWRRFLYPKVDCIVNLFRLGAEETVVAHESLECVQNEPPWLPAPAALFAHRRRTRAGEIWQRFQLLLTDLDGRDVVTGRTQARLEEALTEAAIRTPRGSIVVHTGCLPNVVGDNPLPAMRRLARETNARFYWISSTNDYNQYTANLIADRLSEVAPPEQARDPRGVAIIGGGNPLENGELLHLLDEVGLRPLGVVLPEIGYDFVSRVADASLFVWANQSALRDISELVFERLPVTLLRPASPVGLEGTLTWLRRVAAAADPALGVGARVASLSAAPPWAERLAALRTRTRGHTLVFVSDRDEIDIYLDSTPLFAFSLREILLEMGFSLRILAFGDADDYADVAATLAAEGQGNRVELRTFTTPDELARQLRDAPAGALFSHFAADPRAIAARLNVFSDLDFEMGVEGFFRSAEHLLRLCKLHPFRAVRQRLEAAGT